MIAEDVALYLHNLHLGTQNVDLFLGFQPEEPANSVTIYDESAPMIDDAQALKIDQFGTQVLVRDESYTDARNKIMSIHRALIGFGGEPMVAGGKVVSAVFVQTAPTSIGKDSKGRNEWTAHYSLRVQSVGDLFRL